MARVAVSHPGINDDESKTAPRREPPEEGRYAAIIMKTSQGVAEWAAPPVPKLTVEFQLKYMVNPDGSTSDAESGRRVWQDFILAPVESMPDLSLTHRFELRQLTDACDVKRDADGGFDDDELQQKSVFIVIKHRKGKKKDPATGEFGTFTQISRIDSAEVIADDEVL